MRLIETVLGNVFIWSSPAFYPWYGQALPKWGITAVHDQNLAGVMMMVEGSLSPSRRSRGSSSSSFEEGELRQQLIEQGHDPAQVKRAVRYGRGRELQLQLEAERGGGDARGSLNS